MFPRTLVLIRHAPSVANELMRQLDLDPDNQELSARLASGPDRDWPIIDEGITSSVWAGSVYQRIIGFDRKLPKLFCSSHVRAIQTGFHLSSTWERPAHLWQSSDQHQDWPQWNLDPNLAERSWGQWDNMSWRQFEIRYPEEAKKLAQDPLRHKVATIGAESILDVRNTRVERFLRRLERECEEDDLVIAVTHADWIMACRSLLENLDPFEFRNVYSDPAQRIHNLDAVCYTRQKPHWDFEVTTGYPVSYGIIHMPPEHADLDSVQPFVWKEISRKDYAREELLQLRYV